MKQVLDWNPKEKSSDGTPSSRVTNKTQMSWGNTPSDSDGRVQTTSPNKALYSAVIGKKVSIQIKDTCCECQTGTAAQGTLVHSAGTS